ncbi:hypothetical protein [Streptomyces sp. NPDC001536]|uniref:hypothetical protein n=1 Tax=Streptomyces sp. NPDC001536 TaxID=3364583 RepID=UPI00367918B2
MIGSIDTSEFLVAAPVAAWLVRLVPPRVLGSAVGGVIIVTNVRTLLRSDWIGASGSVGAVVYVLLYAVWAAALTYSIRAYRQERAAESEPAERQPVGA